MHWKAFDQYYLCRTYFLGIFIRAHVVSFLNLNQNRWKICMENFILCCQKLEETVSVTSANAVTIIWDLYGRLFLDYVLQ